MKDGFIKVAAASVNTVVADTITNSEEIKKRIDAADALGVHLLVFPELTVTGCTCGDLFYSSALLSAARTALEDLCAHTAGKSPVVIVGAPLAHRGKLYDCAIAAYNGKPYMVIPKTHLPNANESRDHRPFSSGEGIWEETIPLCGEDIPFGTNLLMQNELLPDFTIGIEISEDLWQPVPSCDLLCRGGATVIANPAASCEIVGRADYRRLLTTGTSARLHCGYIFAGAGTGESSQDLVFSQHHIIAENGTIFAENKPFGQQELVVTDIDVSRLAAERRKNSAFFPCPADAVCVVPFKQELREIALSRTFPKNPFVPDDPAQEAQQAKEILYTQAYGLKKRLEHTHAKTAVLGISGGLDSCLALIVAVLTFDLMKKPRSEILAVTMPCFGTTSRTKSNAELLCQELGVTLRTVNIAKAVTQHFEDIGHTEDTYDTTFENAQARERTQVIMDIANMEGGLLIGTGDLSELALGWATYNGDHMSMYGVNASVPKTLVRSLVGYAAQQAPELLGKVLYDILDTPVSPELIPSGDADSIGQKTEDLVGPYELHDFFLYYLVRFGFAPSKVYRMAKHTFRGLYTDETIKKWLTTFVRRFFMQQFKRSCIPDGPKVGSVSLSPRGDWNMPSDAVARVWLQDLESL